MLAVALGGHHDLPESCAAYLSLHMRRNFAYTPLSTLLQLKESNFAPKKLATLQDTKRYRRRRSVYDPDPYVRAELCESLRLPHCTAAAHRRACRQPCGMDALELPPDTGAKPLKPLIAVVHSLTERTQNSSRGAAAYSSPGRKPWVGPAGRNKSCSDGHGFFLAVFPQRPRSPSLCKSRFLASLGMTNFSVHPE
jgi:hypothetical protein